MEVQNGCVSTGRLLTESEVSSLLGVSLYALRQWRVERRGPPFCKLGRLVRYRWSDLARFIADSTVEVRNDRR